MGYKKIYFDLDHTLWDYDTNARNTLLEIFEEFGIDRFFLNPDSFISYFYTVNYGLWDLYNRGQIDKDFIRQERFKRVLDGRSEEDQSFFNEISDFFVSNCPRQNNLMPGAKSILESLSSKYRLGIITNGFDETQTIKVNASGINEFFETMVTSESSASRKPDRKIFEFALQKSRLKKEEVIMIGDNLKTDIEGAKNFGISAIWYNPEGSQGSHESSISHLEELLSLL